MRIACDVNILVRAALRPAGPARALLELVAMGPHTLVLSSALIDEVRRVFGYRRLQQTSHVSNDDRGSFLAAIVKLSDIVTPEREPPRVVADADDDQVLEVAIQGKADVLCTLDRHFRSPSVHAYCEAHGLTVQSDVDLVRALRALGQTQEPSA